jgi:hypothetical protein
MDTHKNARMGPREISRDDAHVTAPSVGRGHRFIRNSIAQLPVACEIPLGLGDGRPSTPRVKPSALAPER